MIRTVSQLADRNAAVAARRAIGRPAQHCPTHPARVLDGGPVQFRCPEGDGHRVMAADLDHEYHAPIGGAA